MPERRNKQRAAGKIEEDVRRTRKKKWEGGDENENKKQRRMQRNIHTYKAGQSGES